ncbi:MAG: hypothetical protein JW891_02430 [Candidatus Lokiarchaeota archaeon]|nr:hypothetical protein [Candidatus Lokiarchaeota archaeon]
MIKTTDTKNGDEAPKTGVEKIIDFFNSLETNKPLAIAEIVEKTGLSWTFVRKTLEQLKEDFIGLNFEKSGNTWIAWKDRDRIAKKMDDTCGHLLK